MQVRFLPGTPAFLAPLSDMLKSRSLRTLGTYLLIGLGSIAILAPAWLPNRPTLPVEDSLVQILQLVLLIASSAFFFAAAPHARKMKPIFRACGFLGITASISEHDQILDHFLSPLRWKWMLFPIGAFLLFQIIKNRRAFRSFIEMATKTPASGFLGAALILIYFFSSIFGSTEFWTAALNTPPPEELADTLREYLELLACYFIFIATAGFCLPLTKK